jgi:integrase/recombinase XerD
MDPMVIQKLEQAHPLARHINDFLTDLANASASGHTLRAYRGDLDQFAAHYDGEVEGLDAATGCGLSPEARPFAAPTPRGSRHIYFASLFRRAMRRRLHAQGPSPDARLG